MLKQSRVDGPHRPAARSAGAISGQQLQRMESEADGSPSLPSDAVARATDEPPRMGIGNLPTAASKSLRAEMDEQEMIRCAVLGERIHQSLYTPYQRKRLEIGNRRSIEGSAM
jgi:hypothetical protein